jgi:hypothetical protein
MPMIDVYAAAGTFPDPHSLAQDFAAAVMRWEQVRDLPLFANNTAAFIRDDRRSIHVGSGSAPGCGETAITHRAGDPCPARQGSTDELAVAEGSNPQKQRQETAHGVEGAAECPNGRSRSVPSI